MSQKNIQLMAPGAVLEQLAAAVPEDFRENIVVIGSLAAGYHFFGDNPRLQVRTKDVDCLLCPRIHAIPAGEAVANRLLLMRGNCVPMAHGEFPGTPKRPTTNCRWSACIRLAPRNGSSSS